METKKRIGETVNKLYIALQMTTSLRTVHVTRYITPLREGGSMPAIVDADDGFMYALKFRGAGQGIKALIAELIGGELARILGLRVPELVFAMLDEGFGRLEPDEEIQDLLKASVGQNLALHYLSGAITFDPVVDTIDPQTASQIVWLDAFLSNMDRTARNTNMLMWNKELWLIDHGASLYFHHGEQNWLEHAAKPFTLIKDHVLLSQATELTWAHQHHYGRLNEQVFADITRLIPDEWLEGKFGSAEDHRNAYTAYLSERLKHAELLTAEAIHAQQNLV